MSKQEFNRHPKRNTSHRYHLGKELPASRKLWAYRSFRRTNPNVYEKCRHFRRG
ncbi:hypothetical protein [Hungatella hathewayi]|uniref:hypothetical protein n=1 Tax=Hungatella hathewayi TaxID=154046 RepID=UPI001651FB6B|nr:hypothetical protein [Hungatella hathewayi]